MLLERRPRGRRSAGECSGVEAAAAGRRARGPTSSSSTCRCRRWTASTLLARTRRWTSAPVVVFVTAYDQYALRAFEVHAIDYLLKPIDEARFAAGAGPRQGPGPRPPRRRGGPRGWTPSSPITPATPGASWCARATRRSSWTPGQIDWIEAADYYATLHAGGRAHLLRETLTELARRLDPGALLPRPPLRDREPRAGARRSIPLFRGDASSCSRDGTRVRLSRTRRREFQRRFAASGRPPLAPARCAAGSSRCFRRTRVPRRRRLTAA